MFLLVLMPMTSPALAGQGRQEIVIEVNHNRTAVCNWIELKHRLVEESTGAKVVAIDYSTVIFSKETKYGLEVFNLRRYGSLGDYRGRFTSSLRGNLRDFGYRIVVSPISDTKSEIRILMIATCEETSSVAVNIELRKSLRLMREFLTQHLVN
jgi:hypothetical protein